ncbi:MAG: hypothetical protein ABIS21_02585 [Acidimicrobiales bacterium]
MTISTIPDRETPDDFSIVATVTHPDGNTTGPISLTIAPLGGQPPVSAPPARAANGQASQTVSFDVKEIGYNGEYEATVSASASQPGLELLGGHGPLPGRATRGFVVAVPPVPPADVRTAIDPATRVVTLSWKPNPEKDLVGYLVQRNGDVPRPIGVTTFTDTTTANAGGEYVYRVQAVRNGRTAESGLTSDPVTATATVPSPPGTDVTVPPGGAAAGGTGTAGGTTGTTIASNKPGSLTTSGTIDLSGFTSIQSQARRAAPRVVENDPGFKGALPFNTTNTTRLVGDEQSAEAVGRAAGGEDTEVRELGAAAAGNDRQQSAAFLAGGLLATVLLMHVLWIKGEVQREPLEVLVPE